MNTTTTTESTQLTPKQRVFVAEYAVCRNGAEAARRAKYSEKTARQMAAENLTKPDIQAAIAQKEAEVSEKLSLDRNAVIGGIFSGITQARESSDPGGIIKGWLSVAKIMGLDKPEAAKSYKLSASARAMEAKFAAMSDEELIAIVNGNAQWSWLLKKCIDV